MRQVTHALLTRPPLSQITSPPERIKAKRFVRLACVRHAASVHPEPGSNSHLKICSAHFYKLFRFTDAYKLHPVTLMHVFIRVITKNPLISLYLLFLLEFSGLFYCSVIKVPVFAPLLAPTC